MPFRPIDAAVHRQLVSLPTCLVSCTTLAETRGALMTRLCGLPSDEPFAIPATRTVPVFAVRARRLPVCEVFAVRAGCNHDQHLAKVMRWSGIAEIRRSCTRPEAVQRCAGMSSTSRTTTRTARRAHAADLLEDLQRPGNGQASRGPRRAVRDSLGNGTCPVCPKSPAVKRSSSDHSDADAVRLPGDSPQRQPRSARKTTRVKGSSSASRATSSSQNNKLRVSASH